MLGDLVGYGAEPNAVIDRVRALNPLDVIRGNHDKAACGIDDGSSFNYVARTGGAVDAETLTPGEPRLPCGAAGRPADDRRRRSRSATARRSTKTTTSSTRTTRAMRSIAPPGRCACLATRTCRSSFARPPPSTDSCLTVRRMSKCSSRGARAT